MVQQRSLRELRCEAIELAPHGTLLAPRCVLVRLELSPCSFSCARMICSLSSGAIRFCSRSLKETPAHQRQLSAFFPSIQLRLEQQNRIFEAASSV